MKILKTKKISPNILFAIYSFLYLIFNLLGLYKFPFIHSDEPWLSGLSRNIIEKKSFSVTESFFDLYPRNPHAIKSIFHFIQGFFIKFFGYNIFSVRLFSVITSVFCILIFYLTIKSLHRQKSFYPVIYTAIFSINIQFIFASRFARQEIQILLFMLIVNFLIFNILKNPDYQYRKRLNFIALIIGISIGFHPNSFIIAIIFGIFILFLLFKRFFNIKNFLKPIIIIFLFGIFFILFSFKMNPHFIRDYIEFGKTLNVDANPFSRAINFKNFYFKIWNQIGITYYIPNIKFILTACLLFIISFPFTKKIIPTKYKNFFEIEFLSVIAINIGYFLIGRFSSLSILFIIPYIYILFYILILSLYSKDNIKKTLSIILIGLLTIISTYNNIKILNYEDYRNYTSNILKYTTTKDVILCNLNTEYAFKNNQIKDYRNLYYLKKNNISFKEYIYSNNITKIIFSEELDYIYRNTPKWNYLYGDISLYYDEMKLFISKNCNQIGEFKSKTYGNRIVKYMNDYPWNIKIYEVKKIF